MFVDSQIAHRLVCARDYKFMANLFHTNVFFIIIYFKASLSASMVCEVALCFGLLRVCFKLFKPLTVSR